MNLANLEYTLELHSIIKKNLKYHDIIRLQSRFDFSDGKPEFLLEEVRTFGDGTVDLDNQSLESLNVEELQTLLRKRLLDCTGIIVFSISDLCYS